MVGKKFSLVLVAALLVLAFHLNVEALANNDFLKGFVNHEVLALMAVILTVTLASVANIHLALNRIVSKRFNGDEDLKHAALDVKKQLTDNAWYIFWGFCLSVVALLVKGHYPGVSEVVAAVHGFVLWLLALFILCMYDIYKVVFGIVNLEMDLGSGTTDSEDYNSDSPKV